jgi:adenosylmethionine-8-amino-7-oxononanoate aminotransferase
VSNTNAFRAPDGGDPEAFCRRLLDEVEAAIVAAGPDEVALIIAEPVQNSGGCLVPPPGYWRGLRDLADRYGALLMADEVITGCGRLGEWFGIAREGVVPDLVSLAKGLTSAYLPLGAVLAREHVARAALRERVSTRDHIRRASGLRRGGAGEHGHLRARGCARERPVSARPP